MRLTILFRGEQYEINDVSKAESVKEFRKKVEKATNISPKCQQLMYGGKFLSDKNSANLCDYRIEDGYKVILMAREPLEDVTNGKKDLKNGDIKVRAESPPPFMEEREPDDPKPDDEKPVDVKSEDVKPGLSTEEQNECCDEPSKEETIKKLKEMGLDDDAIKAITDEGQPADDQLCKRCKSNPKRKCFEDKCLENKFHKFPAKF